MKKHFIPALLLAATLVMAGCNEREIATSSTSKTGLSTSDPTSLPTSGAESVDSLTSVSVDSKDSQPVDTASEVSNTSNPTSADTGSQDSASSQSTQEVVPVYVDWYVVGQGAFLNGGPSWGDGGVRMQEMEEALGVAHVTFSVGDKFKVSDKAASNAKWLGHDVLDKGTAYVDPDGDGNMVLNQAGTYDVVLTNEEHIKLLATGNTPVKEDPVPETLTHDYYVIGNMADSNWGANKEKYGMDKITSEDKVDYYRSDALELAAGVELKVVDQEKHNDKWFPNNNITIADAGTYYVYYLPSADGQGEPWIDGCVAVTLATADVPAIPSKNVEPPVTHSYSIYGDGIAIDHALKEMTEEEGEVYYAIYEDVHLNAGVVVTIKDGDTLLHFYHWDESTSSAVDEGTSHTAHASGKFTFWIDKNNEVHYGNFQADPAPTCAYQMYVDNGEDWAFHTLSVDAEDASKFTVTVELTAGLAVGFMDSEYNTLGYYNVKTASQSIIECTDDFSDNILILRDGTYTFKLDNSYTGACISISAEFPATYSIIINEQVANLETGPLLGDEANDNNDVYKNVRLEETDIVEIKLGNDDLHFYHYDKEAQVSVDDGTEYLVEYDGLYTFWLAKDGKVWVDVIKDVKNTVQYDVSVGEWANDGAVIFAHSWKEGYAAYTAKVENGKITVIAECDGFMLVRMPSESTDINWDTLWNKTGNLTVGEGTLTFKAWGGEDKISTFEWVATQPGGDDEEPVTEYYLIGGNADDGWTTLKEANKLTAMDDESKLEGHVQYHLDNVHLDQYGQYKIVGVTDGSDEWTYYPPSDGNSNNNYFIETGGTYNVYFVAEGGHEAWSTGKGYMYCHLVEADTNPDETVTDTLNLALTGVSGTNYNSWSDKTSESGVVYAGQSAGGNNSIQLRSNNSNSGIVVTGNAEGLKAKKVIVTFNSNTAANRVVDIYASNTAYTNPTELYSGSAIGSLSYDGSVATVTFEVTGDFAYIGLRSHSGALYLDSVQIVWAA